MIGNLKRLQLRSRRSRCAWIGSFLELFCGTFTKHSAQGGNTDLASLNHPASLQESRRSDNYLDSFALLQRRCMLTTVASNYHNVKEVCHAVAGQHASCTKAVLSNGLTNGWRTLALESLCGTRLEQHDPGPSRKHISRASSWDSHSAAERVAFPRQRAT